jgi:hypothetical protein
MGERRDSPFGVSLVSDMKKFRRIRSSSLAEKAVAGREAAPTG